MKTVSLVETFDGLRHENETQARRHLDKLYGNALCAIGHAMAKLDGKYSKLCEYIDCNPDKFAELAMIKGDMTMQESGIYD